MKVTVIPIAICALSTVTKGLVQGVKDLEIRGRVETIQTSASLRSARILRRVLETWRTCCRLDLSKRPSANAGEKSSQMIIIIIINKHIGFYIYCIYINLCFKNCQFWSKQKTFQWCISNIVSLFGNENFYSYDKNGPITGMTTCVFLLVALSIFSVPTLCF